MGKRPVANHDKREIILGELRNACARLVETQLELFKYDSNPKYLLWAIALSFDCGTPVPQWAGKEFANLFFKARTSYDKVFGRPPTEREFDRNVRNARYGEIIGARIAASKGIVPIDENLFEQIGEEMGIGKTLVKTLYRRHLGRPRRKPKPKRSSGQGRKF